MELRAMPWHESVIEAELAKTKMLINASAVGLSSDETPIPAELIPPELLVLDLIYTPPETRLLRDAKAAGATTTMNGELMLLHQGAAALELWTGQPAPLELMRQKLEEARAGGGAITDRGAAAAQARVPPAPETSEEPVQDRLPAAATSVEEPAAVAAAGPAAQSETASVDSRDASPVDESEGDQTVAVSATTDET
jgi:hypothetical protein